MHHLPIDEKKRLYLVEHLGLKAIAGRFGVSKDAIRKRLVKAGIDRHPRGQLPPKIDKKVLEELYHRKGLSLRDTARHLCVTLNTILWAMKRHGLKARRKGLQPSPSIVDDMGVGESRIVTSDKPAKVLHKSLYHSARRQGKRITILRIDESTTKVTRIK